MTTNEPPPPSEPNPTTSDLPSYGSVPPPEGSYPPPPPGGYPPPGAPGGYSMPPAQNKKALWSMILGIVSLLFCGVIFGPVALILGSQAKSEIAASGGAQTGEGQAKAGFILGIIGIVIWVLFLIVRLSTL